jgi:hypothetical protein
MSIFGDKCNRCRTRTRNTEEGEPICEACAQEMELIVQASGETDRLCPIDQSKMSKEVAHMIVVDRCPTCSGVWLDGGELERLKGDVNQQAILAMSRGFGFP